MSKPTSPPGAGGAFAADEVPRAASLPGRGSSSSAIVGVDGSVGNPTHNAAANAVGNPARQPRMKTASGRTPSYLQRCLAPGYFFFSSLAGAAGAIAGAAAGAIAGAAAGAVAGAAPGAAAAGAGVDEAAAVGASGPILV